MNDAPHEKSGRRAMRRVAALTAAVFGAALLSVPAAAAEATDCQAAVCPPSFDYNGDGYQDLLAVRESDGNLMFYAGRGDGTLKRGVSRGADWGRMDIVMAGDLTDDDKPDLLGRDNKTGYLYTYPGDGSGDFGSRITVGRGWNEIGLFTTAVLNPGRIDLYAISRDESTLYLYPGLGNGTFGPRQVVNDVPGWDSQNTLTTFGRDLLALDGWSSRYGVHNLYGIDASYDPWTWLEFWPDSADDWYRQVTGVGDLDGGGDDVELAGIDSRTGALMLNSFNRRNGSALHEPEVVGTGWGGMRLPSTVIDRTYGYNDGNSVDIVTRQSLTGEVRVYHAADGQAGTIAKWGDFSDMNLIETAGDLDGDGFSDLLARAGASGALYLYPGDGDLHLGSRIQIGSSWNSMSAIVSGHDFNVDGTVDVVARDKHTGDLWLYPGEGNGALGERAQIGTGWNAMREITAVGDLDHDGHPEIIAVRDSDSCLYLYRGKGTGGVRSGVKLGCGWGGMDALAAVGDFDRDRHIDFIARRKSDGWLLLYKGTGTGSFLPATGLADGFGTKDIIA